MEQGVACAPWKNGGRGRKEMAKELRKRERGTYLKSLLAFRLPSLPTSISTDE